MARARQARAACRSAPAGLAQRLTRNALVFTAPRTPALLVALATSRYDPAFNALPLSFPFPFSVFFPALSAWVNVPATVIQRVQAFAPLRRLCGSATQRLPFATIPRALRWTANVVVAASVSV